MQSILTKDFDELLNSELDLELFRNKTFFITGATGLIGSLLTRFLLYADKQIGLNLRILALIRNQEKAQRLYADYLPTPLKFVVAELGHGNLQLNEKVDYIIHAAAVTRSKQMVTDPVETIHTALWGTDEVLRAAVESQAAAMVYLSSICRPKQCSLVLPRREANERIALQLLCRTVWVTCYGCSFGTSFRGWGFTGGKPGICPVCSECNEGRGHRPPYYWAIRGELCLYN